MQPDSAPGEPLALKELPGWRRAMTAATISRLGDVMFDITMVIWVGTVLLAGVNWAPAAVSGLLIGAVLPVLLVGPLAGVYIDRWDRRRVLLISNLVQGAAIAAVVPLMIFPKSVSTFTALAWVYASILVSNCAAQFFSQARLVMLVDIVPNEAQTSAFAAQGAANSMIGIVGPPLAAPLLFQAGPALSVTLNAASYIVSSILLRGVPWRPRVAEQPSDAKERTSVRQDFLVGLRSIVANKVLLTLATCVAVISLGAGFVTTLQVFFVTDELGEAASKMGLLGAGFGVGSLLGARIAPRMEQRFGRTKAFTAGLLVVGGLELVYAFSYPFEMAVFTYFLSAIPLAVVNAVVMPLVVGSVQSEVLGRSMTALNVLPTAASLISMGTAGWLASSLLKDAHFDIGGLSFGGIRLLFACTALLTVAAALVTAVRLRKDPDLA